MKCGQMGEKILKKELDGMSRKENKNCYNCDRLPICLYQLECKYCIYKVVIAEQDKDYWIKIKDRKD